MPNGGGLDEQVRMEPPPLVKESPVARSKWGRWLIGTVLIVLLVVGGWWLVAHHGSGDPGGKILNQLTPAATALPGYGTPSLPWASQPSSSQPYLIKSEPHRDSCDGMAGTEGWSQVVLQAAFDWAGSDGALMSKVGSGLDGLGWQRTPIQGTNEAIWKKTLDTGSTATATLTLSPLGPPNWEFVTTAPPAGKAASGC